jgi:hypothetical protein
VVFLAQQVLLGNLDVLEGDLRRVGCALAELVLLLGDGHSGRVPGDDEGGDALVALVRIGLGVDRVPTGMRAVGDEDLRPVDHVLVALLDGASAHRPDIGAGLRLGETEGGELGLLDQHPEILLLDLLGTADDHWGGREAVAHQRRADPRAAPPDLLLDQTPLQGVETGATVLLRDLGVHEPDLVRLLDDLLRPDGVPVVVPRDRADLLLREVVRQLAQVFLLVGKREVNHVKVSLSEKRANGHRRSSGPGD